MGDLNLNWCIIYLDDVVVYASSVKEHLVRLEAVFQKLKTAGLKLKPSKCELFKKSISYLGHVVSEEGVHTDPKKIAAVKTWARPTTVHTVRKFLGFVNYYRKFIKDYSKIAKPLYNLISGENAKRRTNPVEWTEAVEGGQIHRRHIQCLDGAQPVPTCRALRRVAKSTSKDCVAEKYFD